MSKKPKTRNMQCRQQEITTLTRFDNGNVSGCSLTMKAGKMRNFQEQLHRERGGKTNRKFMLRQPTNVAKRL
jgi:hypothetical protein